MKGNNKLSLNVATMLEALQEYFDKRMGEFAPKITDVNGNGKYDNGFEVSTSDKE